MATRTEIKKDGFLSAIDGLPDALKVRLRYNQKYIRAGDPHSMSRIIEAYFRHKAAYTKWFRNYVQTRPVDAYSEPVPAGMHRLSTPYANLSGYKDVPTDYRKGIYAVHKNDAGKYTVTHIPTGLSINGGTRLLTRAQARKLTDEMAARFPQFGVNLKIMDKKVPKGAPAVAEFLNEFYATLDSE